MSIGKLLIDDQPLQVLPSLAEAIGLNEALILQQIHWLLLRLLKMTVHLFKMSSRTVQIGQILLFKMSRPITKRIHKRLLIITPYPLKGNRLTPM